jgi:NADH-quinone oxidoreductase subunit K
MDCVSAVMHYDYVMQNLAFTYFIFLIGITGIIYNNKNFFLTMLSIEIMYLGLTLSFIMIGSGLSDPSGQIYALVLLVVAAAESAIGLGILIVLYRCGRTIEFTDYEDLRG